MIFGIPAIPFILGTFGFFLFVAPRRSRSCPGPHSSTNLYRPSCLLCRTISSCRALTIASFGDPLGVGDDQPKVSIGVLDQYWYRLARVGWAHRVVCVPYPVPGDFGGGLGRTPTPSRASLVLAIARLFDDRCSLLTYCPLALKPGFSTRNIDGRTNNKDRARQYPNIG